MGDANDLYCNRCCYRRRSDIHHIIQVSTDSGSRTTLSISSAPFTPHFNKILAFILPIPIRAVSEAEKSQDRSNSTDRSESCSMRNAIFFPILTIVCEVLYKLLPHESDSALSPYISASLILIDILTIIRVSAVLRNWSSIQNTHSGGIAEPFDAN